MTEGYFNLEDVLKQKMDVDIVFVKYKKRPRNLKLFSRRKKQK